MKLTPRWRKALLVTHVVTSVGWLGAEAVLLVLVVAGAGWLGGLAGAGVAPTVVYPAAELVCVVLVVPLSLTAWLTGVISALGTRWGLARYWWALAKLASTTVMAILVLFALTPGMRAAADAAQTLSTQERAQLVVPPSVACTLLVLNVVLSVYKPWGRVGTASRA
jgi:hypothetical protein